jgi:hypothetical protein
MSFTLRRRNLSMYLSTSPRYLGELAAVIPESDTILVVHLIFKAIETYLL